MKVTTKAKLKHQLTQAASPGDWESRNENTYDVLLKGLVTMYEDD